MARLPDRFDLWVSKARACPDPDRTADYVLGALIVLSHWYFLNLGTKENPRPAETDLEGVRHLLVFSDPDRISEILPPDDDSAKPLPVIAIPSDAAMTWCLDRRAEGMGGLLVNPVGDSFAVSLDHLAAFHNEWRRRGARHASGYWIPNLTTEEEDFWQEHGL
ncbi:MAG TPA: hypothetical protein VL981_08585 [Candidatus Methylacidiphilales bacterium]|nr:hypothetical protein [Candidatus Methylacidiphilales bacterium]